jgi:hypothetical protein
MPNYIMFQLLRKRKLKKKKSIETFPLLCVSLIQPKESVKKILLDNVNTTKDHCHWAFLAYSGDIAALKLLARNATSLNATGMNVV